MAVEVTDLISLAALATSFIAYLEAKKAPKTAQAIEALTAVIDAAEKTETYLLKQQRTGHRDEQTEFQLAELWGNAAFLISRINKKLSVRLSAKSEFWRNPETWNIDARARPDISLASVRQDATRLMESYA